MQTAFQETTTVSHSMLQVPRVWQQMVGQSGPCHCSYCSSSYCQRTDRCSMDLVLRIDQEDVQVADRWVSTNSWQEC